MTELELARRGLRIFYNEQSNVSFAGPKELVVVLTREVDRRVEMFKEQIPQRSARRGWCDRCGDAMQSWKGGDCMLCVAAMKRVRKAQNQK